MEKIEFHIEGDYDLRQGFRVLIAQKVKPVFNINMGKDRENTVKQFKKDKATKKFLIIDLENHPSNRAIEVSKLSLTDCISNTCFMVQKMEAWFIAQSDRLFGPSVAAKLSKGNPEHIEKPDIVLSKVLHSMRGKGYNKLKDGNTFLQKLDFSKLESTFKDVEKLAQKLQKP